jgi:AcrR family transcriptional regulator
MDRKWDPILKAAKHLFLEKGIAATSMDEVAQAAGATKKTVYNNFGSKDRLVRAVFAEAAIEYRALAPTLAPEADAAALAGFAAAVIVGLVNDYSIGFQRLIIAEPAAIGPIAAELTALALDLPTAALAGHLAAHGYPTPAHAARAALEALTAQARLDRLVGLRPAYPLPPERLDDKDMVAVAQFVESVRGRV